jgi:hypothetical protein
LKRRDKHRQKQTEWKRANNITLNYSFCDRLKVIGEIVFTKETLPLVTEKLKEEFGGAVPEHALNHEFGEVLNHFG